MRSLLRAHREVPHLHVHQASTFLYGRLEALVSHSFLRQSFHSLYRSTAAAADQKVGAAFIIPTRNDNNNNNNNQGYVQTRKSTLSTVIHQGVKSFYLAQRNNDAEKKKKNKLIDRSIDAAAIEMSKNVDMKYLKKGNVSLSLSLSCDLFLYPPRSRPTLTSPKIADSRLN